MFLGFPRDSGLLASAGLGTQWLRDILFLRSLAWHLEHLEIFSPTIPSLPPHFNENHCFSSTC